MLLLINTVALCFVERNLTAKSEIHVYLQNAAENICIF